MNKLKLTLLRFVTVLSLSLAVLYCFNPTEANAQLKEPDVRAIDEPISPFGQGFRNRIGASFILNNFGFGMNGIYARAIGPFTEITFTAAITGIRDASAQDFVYFRTGRKVVPNKYRRALGFPLMIGIEQRVFPYAIADNFRFFVSADAGPAFAFTYPYFDDTFQDNGYRDRAIVLSQPLPPTGQRVVVDRFFLEETNSFFSGWGEGDWHVGFAGDISIGVDFGTDFSSQATFEIGYFFYYYPDGLQIMEPFKKDPSIGDVIPGYTLIRELPNGAEVYATEGQVPFFDEQSYFGTPVIKFTYSWWL